MSELRGKGWCVLGYFIWMLGAGLVLDGGVMAPACVPLGLGAVLFTLGMWQMRLRQSEPEERER
jgi:hypothetical protein